MKYVVVALVVLLAIGALLLRSGAEEMGPRSDGGPVATAESHMDDRNGRSSEAGSVESSSGSSASYTPRHMTVTQIKSTDSRLVALSVDEARWLSKHGFPSANEVAQAHLLPEDDLLRQAREFRNGKAAALLGEQRLRNGDIPGANAAFSQGASNGSLYAREQLAMLVGRRTAGDSGPLRDDVRAIGVAGLEVAIVLGDHRAAAAQRAYAPDLDGNRYGRAIQAQVTEFMRQIAADYASRGKPAPGPDLRPNADLWSKIDSAQPGDPTVITVIDRGP